MNTGVIFSKLYMQNGMIEFPAPYDMKNKPRAMSDHVRTMLAKTNRAFKWDDLPETATRRYIELTLQTNGFIGVIKSGGKIYFTPGAMGGELDHEYFPKEFIVSNPYLPAGARKTYKIGKDCVIIFNDSTLTGLLPHITKYGTLITECELSIWIATVMTRLTKVFKAVDGKQKVQIDEIIKNVFDGDLKSVVDGDFLSEEGMASLDGSQGGNHLTPLIEEHQFLEAIEHNELGLQMSWNGKREYVSAEEEAINSDRIDPFVDDMLKCRQEGAEKVNEMFGTSIAVDFDGVWKENQEEREAELAMMEEEQENPENAEEGEKENERSEGAEEQTDDK